MMSLQLHQSSGSDRADWIGVANQSEIVIWHWDPPLRNSVMGTTIERSIFEGLGNSEHSRVDCQPSICAISFATVLPKDQSEDSLIGIADRDIADGRQNVKLVVRGSANPSITT